MKDLILVESPTKAKTLSTFLKGKYEIEASMGHIVDLPKSKISVDIEHDFEPLYEIPADKKKVVASLRKKVKTAERVILATDPDREGEAISFHLYETLKKDAKKNTPFKRIVFHEITPEAIAEALDNPGEINVNLVEAQTARRVLDRIVGYKLSPLLWKKVKTGLSAGRVQSVALRLIVEREREIEKFKKEAYFRVFVTLRKDPGQARMTGEEVQFELTEVDGEKIESATKINLYDGEYIYKKTIFGDEKKAKELLTTLEKGSYIVAEVNKKETRRSPAPPFITSTLQQEAARRLFFPSKRTMSIAQKLYEHGFITYHRTDSFNLSQQFITKSRTFIKSKFGEKYLYSRTRIFAKKSKLAQEAHEAIRPTNVGSLDEAKDKVGKLGPEYYKLYELIYKRAVATQMSDALFESTSVLVDNKSEKKVYRFKKSGLVMKFDGFLKLWYYEGNEELLPEFQKQEKLNFVESGLTSHETTPPPRYNDASIIGSLEKHGIGRPSTYASIISTIFDRAYVEREEGKFTPSPIGVSVNDFLVKNFGDIDDITFTAKMEETLDDVANGEEKWVPMMKDFYKPFEKEIKKAEDSERVKIETEKTGKKCPQCKEGDLIIRFGRFGKFYACSRFPDCEYKANYAEETEYTCPKDGGKVIGRKTRKGRVFYGCSNYPKCDFAVWKLDELKNATTGSPKSSQ